MKHFHGRTIMVQADSMYRKCIICLSRERRTRLLFRGPKVFSAFLRSFFILPDSQAVAMVLPTAHLNSIRLSLHMSTLESVISDLSCHSFNLFIMLELELYMGRQILLSNHTHYITTEVKEKLYNCSQASYFTQLLCKRI